MNLNDRSTRASNQPMYRPLYDCSDPQWDKFEGINLGKFEDLGPDAKKLVIDWFDRARKFQGDSADPGGNFENFIFAWFSFNGWAACVTGQDVDSKMIARLIKCEKLRSDFSAMCLRDEEFRRDVKIFQTLWPIFQVKALRSRRSGSFSYCQSRSEQVKNYLEAGVIEFEPACWKRHHEQNEQIPLDWPHTLVAIYRLRCNLFHGEKGCWSESDRAIVDAGLKVLIQFVDKGGYLS